MPPRCAEEATLWQQWRHQRGRPTIKRAASFLEKGRPVMISPLRAAEAEWLSISKPSDRPLLNSRGRPRGERFRETGGVAAWVRWELGAGYILRVERTAAVAEGKGATKALLRLLIAISNRYDVPLSGNVVCIPTNECPEPDLDRLIALYRGLGFGVSNTPGRVLSYPPAAES